MLSIAERDLTIRGETEDAEGRIRGEKTWRPSRAAQRVGEAVAVVPLIANSKHYCWLSHLIDRADRYAGKVPP